MGWILRLRLLRENFSFAPSGLDHLPLTPTAYAVGCILEPLRSWQSGQSSHRAAENRVLTHTLPLLGLLLFGILVAVDAGAASKVHAIGFGKWTWVQWFPGTEDGKPLTLKIRELMVDGRVKEYLLGPPHEVTDRLFVVRRAFRMNDSLPEESAPRWVWQRGGWLLVDRTTGRVSPINLPEFDALYSAASWYRDYVAYCGVSADDKKTYAIVAQLSRRKPVLKKVLSDSGPPDDAAPDSACPAPAWQRRPVRVSFEPVGGARQTFAIRGQVVDLVNDEEEEESK